MQKQTRSDSRLWPLQMPESRATDLTHAASVDDAYFAVVGALQSNGDFPNNSERVRADVRRLCALAKQEQLPVEALVVGLKAKLRGMDSFHGMPDYARERVHAAVVSYLIDTYFSDR